MTAPTAVRTPRQLPIFLDTDASFDRDVLRGVDALVGANGIVLTTVVYPGGVSIFGSDYTKFAVHLVLTTENVRTVKSFPVEGRENKEVALALVAAMQVMHQLLRGEEIEVREQSFRLTFDGPGEGHP